jgi:serine/threonine protein kinase
MFATDDLNSLKIIDFGVSAKFTSPNYNMEKFAGTAIYMAPEQARKQGYNSKVDIWSCAMIMHQLITGKHPLFEYGDSRIDYFQKLCNAKWSFNYRFPKNAKELFLKMAQ